MSSHVGFATQQSDAAHVLVAPLTLVNVSFKWFVPAKQEEEAKSAPLPSMSSHVGTSEQALLHIRVVPIMEQEDLQMRPFAQFLVPQVHAAAFG